MARLFQILQGYPKPAFSKKVQRGDQEKFFKNRPNSSPLLKSPKKLWSRWHYPLICMHFKCKDWTRFGRKHWLQKCPNGQVITIFARSLKTHILLKSKKGGPIEIFQKSPKKMPSPLRPKSTLDQIALSSVLLKCKDWTKFSRKQRLQKYPNCQVMAIFARSPKTRIS